MELDARQTIILAIFVLFLGKYLNAKIGFLKEYNIPEAVTGGFLSSLVLGVIYFLFSVEVNFSLEQRDVLLVVFFTTIGLSSQFHTLLEGGKALVILLVAAIFYLCLQNLTGVAISELTGQNAQMGLLGGSVSLSGGHGTTIAWAPLFQERYGIENAMEIGVACATFGLVLGGIIGGPIAKYLIKKHKLEAGSLGEESARAQSIKNRRITVDSVLSLVLILAIAIGIGLQFHEILRSLNIQLPLFVSCLFAGILLTNTVPKLLPKVIWPTGKPTLSLISDLSLGLFLTMSLMSLQLWTLIDLAGSIILLLGAQVVVITLFVIFVIFKFLGKNYEAAVMASGYAGLALGATPTAIANMTAVTQRFGMAPKAFIVIPLIGAFFIDISNAIIIQSFLAWLS